mgnify:CR=1 FL=1
MTYDEFLFWVEFEKVDPLPDPHFSAALITRTIAQAFGGNKRSKIEDFIPVAKAPEFRRQSSREVQVRLMAQLVGIDAAQKKRASRDGQGQD